MNANELADYLENTLGFPTQGTQDAATMLRQQQAEIIELECEKERQREKYEGMLCDRDVEIEELKAKKPNFMEILIDDKYVIRIYKCGIYEAESGNLSVKMPIEEWNEHVKNVKEIFDPVPPASWWVGDHTCGGITENYGLGKAQEK